MVSIANIPGAFMQGQEYAHRGQQIKQANSLRDLYANQGAEIAAGNPNALAALAAIDPMAARGIRRENAADQRAAESHGMSMQVSKASLAQIHQNTKLKAEEAARKISKEQAAEEARKIDGVLSQAFAAHQQGPEAFAAFIQQVSPAAQQSGIDPASLTYENFPQITAALIGARDGLAAGMTAASTMMPKADPSAKEQEISRLVEAGIDRNTAILVADGVYAVSRDPMSGEAIVINKATGQPVGAARQQAGPGPTLAPDQGPEPVSGREAFGLEGAGKNVANTVTDAVGLNVPFPEAQEAQATFSVLQESLLADISNGYDRQPPSWLMKEIRSLTPTPGSVWEGPDKALSKLNAIQNSLANELRTAAQQVNRKMSPKGREALETKISGLEAALGRIQYAKKSLGAGGGDANTTKSGVKWSVVE